MLQGSNDYWVSSRTKPLCAGQKRRRKQKKAHRKRRYVSLIFIRRAVTILPPGTRSFVCRWHAAVLTTNSIYRLRGTWSMCAGRRQRAFGILPQVFQGISLAFLAMRVCCRMCAVAWRVRSTCDITVQRTSKQFFAKEATDTRERRETNCANCVSSQNVKESTIRVISLANK